MKLLVEVVVLIVGSQIINAIKESNHGVIDSKSKIFRQGEIEDYHYRGGGDEEYGDYSDYHDDNSMGKDYSDYGHEKPNMAQDPGQKSASLRKDGGGSGEVNGRRGGVGASSKFWGRIFHIHTHYTKVVGVNWDEDGDADQTTVNCVGLTKASCKKNIKKCGWLGLAGVCITNLYN